MRTASPHQPTARAVRVHPLRAQPHGRRAVLAATRGVLVVPQRGGPRGGVVTRAEMSQAVEALRKLPAADIALLASNGIQINLVPAAGLEDGILGATTIIQEDGGRWQPTLIRIAVHAGLSGSESIGEIVQHEVGHAVSVIRAQDRSEAAAIAYARRW